MEYFVSQALLISLKLFSATPAKVTSRMGKILSLVQISDFRVLSTISSMLVIYFSVGNNGLETYLRLVKSYLTFFIF